MDKMQVGLLTDTLIESGDKLLSKEPDAQYRSEQGKILTICGSKSWGALMRQISLMTGLANIIDQHG